MRSRYLLDNGVINGWNSTQQLTKRKKEKSAQCKARIGEKTRKKRWSLKWIRDSLSVVILRFTLVRLDHHSNYVHGRRISSHRCFSGIICDRMVVVDYAGRQAEATRWTKQRHSCPCNNPFLEDIVQYTSSFVRKWRNRCSPEWSSPLEQSQKMRRRDHQRRVLPALRFNELVDAEREAWVSDWRPRACRPNPLSNSM